MFPLFTISLEHSNVQKDSDGRIIPCLVCGKNVTTRWRLYFDKLERIGQRTAAGKDAVKLLRNHCRESHPQEYIWNVLPSIGCLLPHLPTDCNDNAIDLLLHHALSGAASKVSPNDISIDGIKMMVLTYKRFAFATALVENFWSWPESLCKVASDKKSKQVLKQSAIEVAAMLEQFVLDQIRRYYVKAVGLLGVDRCFNRYQLLFFQRSRYRLVMNEKSTTPNRFLSYG
jgi:DNA-directed RNA polymerase subunit N (RpoN/RPB10)